MRANSMICLSINCQRSLCAAIGRSRSRSSSVPGTVGSIRSPNLMLDSPCLTGFRLCCCDQGHPSPPPRDRKCRWRHARLLEIRNYVLTPALDLLDTRVGVAADDHVVLIHVVEIDRRGIDLHHFLEVLVGADVGLA